MPFASINPTNPRANLWNFCKLILRIGDFEKLSFFESAIVDLKKKFCFIHMKISHKLCDGTQFWCFPWFPSNSLHCIILRYLYIFLSHKLLVFLNIRTYIQWLWLWLLKLSYVAANTTFNAISSIPLLRLEKAVLSHNEMKSFRRSIGFVCFYAVSIMSDASAASNGGK